MTESHANLSARGSAAFIALGSNQPAGCFGPKDILAQAIEALHDLPAIMGASSRIFQSPCFPAGAGPDYANAVVEVRTELQPKQLLEALHQVEREFGRMRATRWGARTLDLDLLSHGNLIAPDPVIWAQWRDLPLERQREVAPEELILPHPRIQDRAFVLVPLADVAPGWVHPVTGVTVGEMLQALPPEDVAALKPLPLA